MLTYSSQTCRVRHRACDGGYPECRQCLDDGRQCTPHFNVRFSPRRIWTPNLNSRSRRRRAPTSSSSSTCDGLRDRNDHDDELLPVIVGENPPAAQSNHPEDDDDLSLHGPTDPTAGPSNDANTSPQIADFQVSAITLPLSRREAVLFQYFGDHLGHSWLDLTDPDFSFEVLKLAPTCPVLRWSVLALASFHLCQKEGHNGEEAETFHQKAVDILLSVLHDGSHLNDGAVLASTVILRLYEELRAHCEGQDAESHLLGGHVFVHIDQDGQDSKTRLARAAFWIHQRQDVVHAILHQSATRTILDERYLSDTEGVEDVYGWAKVATSLTAQVIDFCFGTTTHTTEVYDALKGKLNHQFEQSMRYFPPIYYAVKNVNTGYSFPEIRFTLDASLIAYVHFQLSKMLMALYNPAGVILGVEIIRRHKQMKSELQSAVRAICGVAYYNICPIGRTIACLSITLCSEWFEDPSERIGLLTILSIAEQENGWSTQMLQNTLRNAWGLHHSTYTTPIS